MAATTAPKPNISHFTPEQQKWITTPYTKNPRYTHGVLHEDCFAPGYRSHWYSKYKDYKDELTEYCRLFYDIDSPFLTIKNKEMRTKICLGLVALPPKLQEEIVNGENMLVAEMALAIVLNCNNPKYMQYITVLTHFEDNVRMIMVNDRMKEKEDEESSLSLDEILKLETLKEKKMATLNAQREVLEKLEEELFGFNYGLKAVANKKHRETRIKSKPAEELAVRAAEYFNIGFDVKVPLYSTMTK